MAISPASTANYDWFLDTLCRSEQEAAAVSGASVHDRIASEVDAALKRRFDRLFHPFCSALPMARWQSASFFGLHGWHDRGDLIKSVLEGHRF